MREETRCDEAEKGPFCCVESVARSEDCEADCFLSNSFAQTGERQMEYM